MSSEDEIRRTFDLAKEAAARSGGGGSDATNGDGGGNGTGCLGNLGGTETGGLGFGGLGNGTDGGQGDRSSFGIGGLGNGTGGSQGDRYSFGVGGLSNGTDGQGFGGGFQGRISSFGGHGGPQFGVRRGNFDSGQQSFGGFGSHQGNSDSQQFGRNFAATNGGFGRLISYTFHCEPSERLNPYFFGNTGLTRVSGESPHTTWIIDSGASNHVTGRLDLLHNVTEGLV